MIKILVADEQPLIRKTIVMKLEALGFQVTTVGDGKAAIERFDAVQPDLVITDLLLPYMTGLEFITHIRKMRLSTIPILVVSQVGLEKNISEAFYLGASDYLTKPFRPDEIVNRVLRFVQAPCPSRA
jgi:two-component system, OmpR family, response regulator VicR